MIDVIHEITLDRFQYLAATETLAGVSVDDIVALANDALNSGDYDDQLLAIIDAKPRTSSEVIPHLDQFCLNNGIPIRARDWSLKYLLHHFIKRMAASESDPDGELVKLMHAIGPETLRYLYEHAVHYQMDRILHLGMQYNYFIQLHNVDENELENVRISCARLLNEMRDAANTWLNGKDAGRNNARISP